MNLSIWKSRRNKTQLVASLDNGVHIYFDCFELEPVEASLWLYQGSTLVACFRGSSLSLSNLTDYARRMVVLGAQNYGAPLSEVEAA